MVWAFLVGVFVGWIVGDPYLRNKAVAWILMGSAAAVTFWSEWYPVVREWINAL